MSKTYRRNPMAREVRGNPLYRQQKIQNKTGYQRKLKHRKCENEMR